MKRGKDDEKSMGPMFPRLHVNDAEKGGPRAPPRNKMALYEQLSIPSQRFNPGRLPLNPNNSSNLVPPNSSSQGSGHERSVFFPHHLPSSIPTPRAEKLHARQSDVINSNTSVARLEQRKKVGDEDDFMVPIFVNSEAGQYHGKNQNSMDREKFTPLSSTYSGHSVNIQNSSDKDPKCTISPGPNLGNEVRSQRDVNLKEYTSSRDHSVKSTNVLTGKKIDRPVQQANASLNKEYRDHLVANFDRLHDTDASLQQEYRARSQPEDIGHGDGVLYEAVRDIEKGNASRQRSGSCWGDRHSSPSEPDIDSEYCGDKTFGSLQMGNVDRSDDVSETSMVDSISGLDISPDDVVGIIGQKHFWKARRAIVNQQRVFSVQVFELHRLIKVQRLIAESPHLLLEDGAYLGKPSLRSSPAKKLPLEYVVKPPPHVVKHKDDSEKPNRKMECSAENAVGKTSLSSVKNGSHLSNYGPHSGNQLPAPVATDNTKMGPWCFPQPPGHQWLVPVMSPSEGLVYKPYPGPGFMGTVCGGCGPLGSAPLTGNFMNPGYGVPASHQHHQGIGVLPGAPPVGHAYFPPYSMPVMNPAVSGSAVEQMNRFPGPDSHGHAGQLSGGGANFNMQNQSSCNLSSQKSGAVSQVVKFLASRDSELQGSTASSPIERAQGVRTGHVAEGRDALPLFPTTPVVPEGASQLHDTDQPTRVIKVVPHNPRSATDSQLHDTDQPTRVIKVVPHNPRSATESAARIFQSIQEERKQY